jgi:hypothetical protein
MKMIPIVNPSSEHLFSEVVEKKEVEIVKGIFVKTGALKFGQTFDLISVCQSPLLIDKGLQDFTDILGETIRLTKIYFKAISWSSEDGDSSDDVRVIDVTEEPGAVFRTMKVIVSVSVTPISSKNPRVAFTNERLSAEEAPPDMSE